MQIYKPAYLGCIARDEWKLLTAPMKSGKSAWVMNTDPSTKPGQHWVAFLISLDDQTVEYYDSFAEDIPKDSLVGLKDIVGRVSTPGLLKMKVNRIADQDANSINCGWFACRFIIDRFRGRPFKEVTKFDDSVKGEAAEEKFKKQYGGGFSEYIFKIKKC